MGLGMSEVVLILVIALIVFGPRKLPELGKSLGQAMAQFRRASDEFKRTWEQEVELEKVRKTEPAALAPGSEPGYGTESDYNYGYDSATDSSRNGTLNAAENVSSDRAETPATVAEKKAEPHWI